MVTPDELVQGFENYYKNKSIYVWGMNGEMIDEPSIRKYQSIFQSSNYPPVYWDNKLREGHGHFGADCSGAFAPFSGYDATVQGYFDRCVETAAIDWLGLDRICLVFAGQERNLYHMGLYCGNGFTIEFMDSSNNCVKQLLDRSRWSYFGIPDFVNYSATSGIKNEPGLFIPGEMIKGRKIKIVQNLLICNGFSCGRWADDGEIGPDTLRAMHQAQQHFSMPVRDVVTLELITKLLENCNNL